MPFSGPRRSAPAPCVRVVRRALLKGQVRFDHGNSGTAADGRPPTAGPQPPTVNPQSLMVNRNPYHSPEVGPPGVVGRRAVRPELEELVK